MKRILLYLVIIWNQSVFSANSYDEPSEYDMQSAIERTIIQNGAKSGVNGEVIIENAMSGISMKITAFEKLGCSQAEQGAGYFCSYQITTKTSLYSNEGSASGDKHATSANAFFGALLGGANGITENATRRFIKSKNGWIVTEK